ncbi:MAG: sigma factor-like helix-turn-helix DNA-binding protein [Oscillospiraceae bacterium]
MIKLPKNLEICYLIDTYSAVLTDKQREVIELYYYEDLSLAEIAQNSKISRQGVRDAIKRGEAIITELEEKLGFARKYREIEKQSIEIKENAQEIQLFNGRFSYSEQINGFVDKIIESANKLLTDE